jgi:hypothetical protein
MPYRDKFTVFAGEEDFMDSDNPGFLPLGEKSFKVRLEDKSVMEYTQGSVPKAYITLIETIMDEYKYLAYSTTRLVVS